MIYALLVLTVISNAWCSRTSIRHVLILTPIQDSLEDLSKFTRSQASKFCEWKAPPENAQNYRECGRELLCKVEQGSYAQNGMVRYTRCDPDYVMIQGDERDTCHNGKWSSSDHKCVRNPNLPSKPSGHPECTEDEHCADNKQCRGEACIDMCPRYCGKNSVCKTTNHVPKCECLPGYRGNPYISCTKEESSSHLNAPVETPVLGCRSFTNSMLGGGPMPNDTCLITANQYPGQFSGLNRGEFPYLGIIGDETFNSNCYGVLISERWFLSSADCCDTCNKKVKLGIFNDEYQRSNSKLEYDVVQRVPHPNYRGGDLDNVGLYKLKNPVKFSQFIRPACLVTDHQPPGTRAIFVGKLNGTLVKTTTEIWTKRECEESSSTYKDESMFCVNKLSSVNGLHMNTGLPVVGPLSTPYCMHGLLGLATFGDKTKSKGNMRMSYYVPWIESIISPSSS